VNSSKGPPEVWHFLFSFRMMLAAGLAVVAVLTVSTRFHDPDMWFHMKLGQVVWETHTVPAADTFSFTAAGHPWIAHEWLAEVSIYLAYKWGGYTGLMGWLSLLTSVLLVMAYALCYRVTENALVSFLGALCAWFFATIGMAIRPLLLGHIFLLAELLLLEAGSRRRRWFWGLPPLFAVWVNCHGSYFFGLGVLFVYWASSFVDGRWGLIVGHAWDPATRKALGLVMIVCGLALCVNPVGIHLLLYPLNTLFQQPLDMNAVDEWKAPDLRESRSLAMLGALVAIFLLPLWRKTELELRELALLAAALWMATQHQRMLFLFGIIVCPILSRLVAPLLGKESDREQPVANAVLLVVFAVAIVWGFPARADLEKQVQKRSPVAAVDYIRKAGLQGPMLNEYVFGDYLIWALPEHKVFIDGRGDIYDWSGVFAEYGRLVTVSEDPNRVLNKYGIRFCLLAPNSSLVYILPYLGWKKTYEDPVAAIFERGPTTASAAK
jgi:hypothetical protein